MVNARKMEIGVDYKPIPEKFLFRIHRLLYLDNNVRRPGFVSCGNPGACLFVILIGEAASLASASLDKDFMIFCNKPGCSLGRQAYPVLIVLDFLYYADSHCALMVKKKSRHGQARFGIFRCSVARC